MGLGLAGWWAGGPGGVHDILGGGPSKKLRGTQALFFCSQKILLAKKKFFWAQGGPGPPLGSTWVRPCLSGLNVNKSEITHFRGPLFKNNTFFRKSKIGDWKNHLTPKMAMLLNKIIEHKLNGSGLVLHVSSNAWEMIYWCRTKYICWFLIFFLNFRNFRW